MLLESFAMISLLSHSRPDSSRLSFSAYRFLMVTGPSCLHIAQRATRCTQELHTRWPCNASQSHRQSIKCGAFSVSTHLPALVNWVVGGLQTDRALEVGLQPLDLVVDVE